MLRLAARRPVLGHVRYQSTQAALADDEPQYPVIQDLSLKARQYRQKKEVIAQRIQALPTVEEKIMALNMKKYFGFKCIMMNDQTALYNTLPLIQYATRTKFHETADDLPGYYARFNEGAQNHLPNVKAQLEEAIYFELECYKQEHDLTEADLNRKQKANILSSSVARQVHRVLVDSLAEQHQHLQQIDTDVDPVHEAFWMVGGIEPLTIVQKSREGVEWQKENKMEPVDRPFQYIGEIDCDYKSIN